ncbi:hypothetical protein ACH4JS_36870 [Streptomyces sp. NPDC017638]|uniref:hypothetical protein n=1 Tax=Streptomyces sp. NPDC017638 TaxID=3365004 RepID=UPI0037AC8C31
MNGPPAGSGREIQYRLTVNGTVLYYGYAGPQPTMRNFTEPGQQIVRDIQAGYPYSVVDAAGARYPVAVGADGQLHANGQMLEYRSLRDKPIRGGGPAASSATLLQ